ncbi:MAG: hypothetical protein QW273_00105 [Candidatus Pacearchaeota archaeon]
MIKEQIPITMREAAELSSQGEKAEKLKKFVKEFKKQDGKKEKEVKEKLFALNLTKLDKEDIISLVEFMPQTAQEVLKILPHISLDQEEINKILEITKE